MIIKKNINLKIIKLKIINILKFHIILVNLFNYLNKNLCIFGA